MSGQDRDEQMLAGPHCRYPEGLALEFGDIPDRFVAEQFQAPDMQASQGRDRPEAVDPGDERRGINHREIRLAASDRLGEFSARWRVDIVDIAEPFGAQQLFGDILRGKTDRRDAHQAHAGRFNRLLRGQHSRRTD